MAKELNQKFGYTDVKEAYSRIKDYIWETPLVQSYYLNKEGRKYYFKLECLQQVRSFKIRGALSKITSLTDEEKALGVATISSGNHGIAVSYAAAMLGIKDADIIVPETTPKSKLDKITYYQGNPILMGQNYDGAHSLGKEYINAHNRVFVDSYFNDPLVYAGNGTIAIEILEQNPGIDTIAVPIGGGGLLTGIAVAAKAIKPDIRIVGIQTAACPAMIKSYEDNIFYESFPNEPSICDALIGGIGQLSYEMAKDYVDDFIAVDEDAIRQAVAFMIRQEKIIVEPGSAVCVAAAMNYSHQLGGQNVALIMSGGNLDEDLMMTLLHEYGKK